MLPLFPRLFPDELFYSACARYHKIIKNESIRMTLFDLFGQNIKVLAWDFPHRLSVFSEQLPKKGCLPVNDLVENNTMVPLYRPFLKEETINEIVDGMLSQVSCCWVNRSKVGNVNRKTPKLKNLRCCPDCMVEDKKKYHDCFWHRTHQVHGVLVCHKHGKVLWNTNAFLDFRPGFKVLFPLSDALLGGPVTDVEMTKDEIHNLRWIANAVHYLLNNNVCNCNNLKLWEIYRNILLENMWCKKNVVNYLLVKEHIVQKYGIKLMQILFPYNVNEVRKTWIYKLLNGQRLYKSPLCHLMFIHAFNVDLEDFFSGLVEASLVEKYNHAPFGSGPWPCLNAVCAHYREDVVTDFKVYKSKRSGEIVGRFTCNCGFSYSRVGPDKKKNDRFKKDRILSFTKELDDEIYRLINEEGLSLTYVSRRLDIPITSVQRRFMGKKLNKDSHRPCEVANEMIRLKRNDWLKVMRENPSLSRTYLRGNFRGQFNWLERYDRDWLFDNLPPRVKPGPDFDWDKLDEEIAPKINGIAKQIKKMRNPFVRVTPTAIFHILGRRKYLKSPKFLVKVPRVKTELIKVVESTEEFQIRRLKIVAGQLNRLGKFCKSDLITRAGIVLKKSTTRVNGEIDRLIN